MCAKGYISNPQHFLYNCLKHDVFTEKKKLSECKYYTFKTKKASNTHLYIESVSLHRLVYAA